MWIFKNKTIVVDCFTDDPSAYNYHPIKSAKSYYPTWWKNKQATMITNGPAGDIPRATIKKCDGIINLYSNSFVLPAWTDIQIRTDNVSFYIMLGKTPINDDPIFENNRRESHSEIFDDKLHMKLISPWYLKQNKNCNFALIPSIWNDPINWNNFTILPGALDFKYQHSSNINMFLERNRDRILIEAGTPFYNIVPMTDAPVETKCHLVTTEELKKLSRSKWGSFSGGYKNAKKQDQEKSSCPFGFSKK